MSRPEQGASARARAADGGPGAGAAPVLPDLGAFEAYAASARAELAGEWRPFLFRLAPGEHPGFEAICAQRGLRVHDRIEAQVRELATVRSPAAGRRDRAAWAAGAIARAGHPCAVGAWAYFPWTDTVVHVLDREDFFAVITDRNRDKLTREEQRLLRGKRIGVMGLSVGGEAAVTLAQEHLCGRIVLADFDALDLSNLNRLGAGVDALGVNKAVIVARRIALIDPWLDVTVMRDGVTADNVEAFLDGLDLLVEECDGLAMKYDVRRLARQRRLDIVFAGDVQGEAVDAGHDDFLVALKGFRGLGAPQFAMNEDGADEAHGTRWRRHQRFAYSSGLANQSLTSGAGLFALGAHRHTNDEEEDGGR